MITSVDTNVLLDLLIPGAPHRNWAWQALESSFEQGTVIVSEPVYAELAGLFLGRSQLDEYLEDVGIDMVQSSSHALYSAGLSWRDYSARRPRQMRCASCGNAQSITCDRCGEPIRGRQHVVADFLIGAHALHHADKLLTRDRSIYATYFPALEVVSPS